MQGEGMQLRRDEGESRHVSVALLQFAAGTASGIVQEFKLRSCVPLFCIDSSGCIMLS